MYAPGGAAAGGPLNPSSRGGRDRWRATATPSPRHISPDRGEAVPAAGVHQPPAAAVPLRPAQHGSPPPQPRAPLSATFPASLGSGGPQAVTSVGGPYRSAPATTPVTPALGASSSPPLHPVALPAAAAPPNATPCVKGASKIVLVGVAYRGDPTMQLPSASQDVRAVQQYLTRIGFTPRERRVLTEDNPESLPTRANILSALRWLVRGSVAGDSLFFHFAGHGGRSVPSGAMHDTGLEEGEAIAPVDYKTAGLIYEDELHDILVGCLASGARLTCIFDCVKVGTILDLPFKLRANSEGFYLQETPSPPIPSEVITISYSSPAGAVNALTTAFIAACNTGPHITYRSLVVDMAQMMARQYGGGLDTPAPMLCMSKSFELSDPFTLSALPDPQAAGGDAGGAPMTSKEEELSRRIRLLESQLNGTAGGRGAPPAHLDPYSTPTRQQRRAASPSPMYAGGGGGAYTAPRGGGGGALAVSPAAAPPPPNQASVLATGAGVRNIDTEVAGAARAVFIGVEYRDTPFELPGAVRALDTFQRLVMDLGFNARAQVLTEDAQAQHLIPNRSNIVAALKWLVKDAQVGDVLLLYFSGYGATVPEYEAVGISTAMAPVDFHYRGFLTADELHNVLFRDLPQGVKCVVVSDLAYGGAILRPPYRLSMVNGAMCYAHEPHEWVDHANADVLALSAIEIQQQGGIGQFTDALVAVLETTPQLEVSRLMHDLRIQLSMKLSGSPNASPLLQSSKRLNDRALFYLGNRPQGLQPRAAPPPQHANLAPHRNALADPAALSLSNMPGIYKVEGGLNAPAAVAVDQDTGRVTLFCTEYGERQGTLAGNGTKIKLDIPWGRKRAVEGDLGSGRPATRSVTFSTPADDGGAAASPLNSPRSPTSPDSLDPDQSPPRPPALQTATPKIGPDADPKQMEVTYNPSTGRLTFPDGGTWVHQGGRSQSSRRGGGDAATSRHPDRSTPGAGGAVADLGWGDNDNVPTNIKNSQTILGASKALLVGVGYRFNPSMAAALPNPTADVRTAHRFLQRQGFRAETRVLSEEDQDEKPTRANIMSSLRWLARDAVPGDSLFFMFSGHGAKGARVEMDNPVFPAAARGGGGVHSGTYVASTPGAPPATPFSAVGSPGVMSPQQAATPMPGPYAGGGLGEETALAPSDAHQAGVIDGEEILATFIPALPPGVKLTVLLDLDQGGCVVDLPFCLEALPNGGFSTKDHPAPTPSMPDINVLYIRGRDRQNGSLSTAFMAVLNQCTDITNEEMLTGMKNNVRQRTGDAGCSVGIKSSQRLTAADAFHLGADSQQVLTLQTAPFPGRVTSNSRAVLISVAYGDRLPHTQAALRELETLLVRKGYNRDAMRILTEPSPDGQPTKGNILASMRWLTNRVEPGDSLFFYFAGYGAGGGTGRGELQPPAAHGIAPMDFMTYGCISGAEIEAALLSNVPAGASLTGLFDAPTTVVPTTLPYVMVGERDGGTTFSHIPAPDYPAKAMFITTTPDQTLRRVVPMSGVLTVGFVQTVMGHGRDPTYAQLMHGLRSVIGGKVPDSGHTPTILSTRRFSDHDPFVVNTAAGAEQGRGVRGVGGDFGAGAMFAAPPPPVHREYSPERLERLDAYHADTMEARMLDRSRKELLESMRDIQQNIADAMSVARNAKGGLGLPRANHSPQHFPSMTGGGGGPTASAPAAYPGSLRRSVSPTRPGSPDPIAFTRVLTLKTPAEPLGMRLVPTAQGMSVAAVTPYSPAQRSGIVVGDIVHKIASYPVTSSNDVRTARAYASQANMMEVLIEVTPAAEEI